VVAFSLAELLGSWRIALALWGATACGTALLWVRLAPRALARFTPGKPATRSGSDRARLWRSANAWRITIVVTTPLTVGVTAVAWLAPMAHERGASPAVAATFLLVFQVVQVVAMVGLPALSDRSADRRPALAVGLVVTVIGIAALVPDGLGSTAVGAILLSFGVGGSSAISLVMLGETPRPNGDVAALSAMAFVVAFSFAAVGPAVLGVLHDATGTFSAGLACLMALVAVTLASTPYLGSKPTSHYVGGVS
jgi:CP family cyanate transporter-like MFS transporter